MEYNSGGSGIEWGNTTVLNDGNVPSLIGQCDAFYLKMGIIYICKILQPLGTCRSLVK